MHNRRSFLAATASAATVALLPVSGVQGSTGSAGSTTITAQLFAPLIGSSFRCFDGAGGAYPVTLLKMEACPSGQGLEQFRLAFGLDEGYGKPVAGLYRLFHPQTGVVLVHLEPSLVYRQSYVADFSLLT